MKDCKFFISLEDWKKIHDYAKVACYLSPDILEKGKEVTPWKNEIGGMAVIKKQGDNYLIQDPVILKQEVTGVVCILDKVALSNYYNEMFDKHNGRKEEVRYLWWHSHHTMSATWSGTDTDTIEETRTNDWTASLLINLKGDHKLRIQYFHPIECNIDIEEGIQVINDDTKTVPMPLIKEVFEKCSEKVESYGGQAKIWQNRLHTRNGWGATVNNGTQTHLFTPNQSRMKAYDTTGTIDTDKNENLDTFGDVNMDFIKTYVQDLNNLYITTQIDYKTWRNCVRESNKRLNEQGIKIIEFKSKKLHKIIFTANPEDFIDVTDDNCLDIDDYGTNYGY